MSKTVEIQSAAENAEVVLQSSWEDDETLGTMILRAGVVLVAGAFLLWAQHNAGLNTSRDWGRWVGAAFLCNLVLPLGVVWMLFGQGLTRLEWLKDQKHNAWNYGWDFREWKKHLKTAAIVALVMLPLLWFYSRTPEVRNFYEGYLPEITSPVSLLWLLATVVLYMLCWEWFFRGFLLFGTAQGFGFVVAIVLQAGLFGLAHWGKPSLEMYSSFVGGALLGILCWREKSFLPAFLIHAFVHIIWIILCVYL